MLNHASPGDNELTGVNSIRNVTFPHNTQYSLYPTMISVQFIDDLFHLPSFSKKID